MPVIEITNLRKRYREQLAVDDVSLTVEEGEIFGILGPNGSGKTTTVECVNGLRQPDSGTVSVLGMDPQRDGRKLRSVVGAQLQESELPDRLTVREALNLYRTFYPDPADTEKLIHDWGLTEKRDTQFKKLSGGQKQRLSIALALVGNPRIAILDELTTGLDPHARRDAWDMIENIRNSGVTVVLVTHFMEEAERLCDRIALIVRGRVTALDTPAGLRSSVDDGQRVRFHPSRPLDPRLLADLPDVTSVTETGPEVVVTGTGNAAQAVLSFLAREGIQATRLRVDQASLDDAFVALTGRRLEN